MKSVDVRNDLVDALQLDLVGPMQTAPDVWRGIPEERLDQPPSRWYLTGFIVPIDAEASQRAADVSADELDAAGDLGGVDDDVSPDPPSARKRYLPASIGMSLLVPPSCDTLKVRVTWGDYKLTDAEKSKAGLVEEWTRTPRVREIEIVLPDVDAPPSEDRLEAQRGLIVMTSVRTVSNVFEKEGGMPADTRAVSVFLVNQRPPEPDNVKDQASAFQTCLEVRCEDGFVPRPNLHSIKSEDFDDRIADLQYHDACEFAVGHNVATDAEEVSGKCEVVRTCWIPTANVERVAASKIDGVELSMDRLSELTGGDDALAKLGPLVSEYRAWIQTQKDAITSLTTRRADTATFLLGRAGVAADRIDRGIKLLADEQCLLAFTITNRAMATAARQRMGVMAGRDPETVKPAWRPFQLAFVLMNLVGIAQPTHDERGLVDLLFFPTGGGKTEAYLGLAAFTIVLRRLRNPGIGSAGLSVLMRYTLRLLTMDQLGRAATLICALELERQRDVTVLGEWPFEIGLWVGRAATPNIMGRKGVTDPNSARAKTIAYQNNDSKPSPIPLEECPWCGTKFTRNSFKLIPSQEEPEDLRIVCANRDCSFTRGNPLPILGVDEPIYRRLPAFMIATVDKFAAMPWTGEVGGFFGRVQRFDRHGFYGPGQPLAGHPLPADRLLPPDLVIQDELHLISGPLGTMVGLYESALDELSSIEVNGHMVRPKIVASTATVRRAEDQIRNIFNRRQVDVFPPPGPDRRNSFFARTEEGVDKARVYVGVAAQGRSPKIVMLRVYLALLGAAQKAYDLGGRKSDPNNPADPYMTLLGYFNSLRELGGARRLIEDEVRNRVSGYGDRMRLLESEGLFANRDVEYEPVELTSRVNTSDVSEAKRRLSRPFSEKGRVDVAIATNMISVGLDITRLGLMVVFGQPKTTSEYIQSTSRVGRDVDKPGLVVTILNVHKPRDRSHYERFAAYHESFYRSVEATSVTPFSPRALDRGLAGALVSLARHSVSQMTPPRGAVEILHTRSQLDSIVDTLADRARDCARAGEDPERTRERVRIRSMQLLNSWSKMASELVDNGAKLQYQREVGDARPLLRQFLDPELKNLPSSHPWMQFRANRSLRDVEPDVDLWMKKLDGTEVEEDQE